MERIFMLDRDEKDLILLALKRGRARGWHKPNEVQYNTIYFIPIKVPQGAITNILS
jgi:hypothetical protein